MPATADTQPTVYGSVVFGHNWEDMGDNTPYGLYSVPSNDGNSIKLEVRSNNIKANGGGVYVDGRYYLVDFSRYNYDGTVSFRVFDVDNDWKLVSEQNIKTYSNVASDLAYDPTTDNIYGCFKDTPQSTQYFFGTLNPITGFSSKIADVKEELIAIAANRDGKVYGIGLYGMLYSIDKTTGALTEIGQTGKTVKYAQSATFDYASGRMLWAMTPHYTDESPEICEVNLTTGKATTLTTIPDRYEFTGIYTTSSYAADGAPQRVNKLQGSFSGFSTNGNITSVIFTMPQTSMDGNQLSNDDLQYSVYIDNELKYTAKANAGADIYKTPLLSRGLHTVKVAATNEKGRGPWAYSDFWTGTDVVNPEGPIAIKESDNDVLVTWLAPEKGLHGGYFMPNKVTYTVTRQPDNVKVYEGKETQCTDNSIENLQFNNYYYEVVAKTEGSDGEFTGDTIKTSTLQLGKNLKLPYEQGFDTEAAANTMTIDDSNGDGNTWQFYADCMIYGASEEGLDADDWLITPAFNLSKDSVYMVTVDAKADEGYTEKMEVATGTKAEGKAMTQTILPVTTITNYEYQSFEAAFVPKQDGVCHVGIHVCSPYDDASYIYIDKLSVKKIGSVKAPSNVTNASATPVGAERKVQIAFNAPTKDMINGTLTTNVTSIVVRNSLTNDIVKTFSDVAPGTKCEFVDTPSADGTISYTITASNEYGSGSSVTVNAYVGLDTPAAVGNLKISATDDGKVSASWTAPQKGIHNGTIDMESMKYNIENLNGSSLLKTVVTNTAYNEQITMSDGKQRLMWYVVTPENAQGKGTEASTDTIFVGNPYTLPYAESFKARGLQRGPWLTGNGNLAEWNILQYGTYADSQDDDFGLIGFSTVTAGATASFTGPKITLKSCHNPLLKFYTWQMKRAVHKLNVYIVTPDGEQHAVDSFVDNDTELEGNEGEWKQHRYDLSAYKTYDYVQLRLTGVGGRTDDLASIVPLYVDNITLTDPLDQNLSVSGLETLTDKVEVGDEITFTATVKNTGSETADGYNLCLYRDDKLVYTKRGTSLDAEEDTNLTLKDVPNSDAKETSTYVAKIVWDADADESDNTSNSVVVTVLPGRPFISAAFAQEATDKSGVVLTWDEPLYISRGTTAETITEDFESYAPFTIKHFGEWTLYDGDGARTIGIQDGKGNFVQYDNVEKPMAFQIFNPSAAGINEYYFPTHSGKQVAAAFTTASYSTNDDWLISPEVDGAQTIKFWACSPDCNYYGTQETMQILYSTTDTDPDDFKQIGSDITVPGSWKQMTANLPEGTRYFALRCVSKDQYILFIDDITYRKAARDFSLTGYNVYRDGTLLTTVPATTRTFVDNGGNENSVYKVSAVYNTGESLLTTVVWGDPTAINNAIISDSASDAIYDISGRSYAKGQKLSNGIYVIKQGNQYKKVMIK